MSNRFIKRFLILLLATYPLPFIPLFLHACCSSLKLIPSMLSFVKAILGNAIKPLDYEPNLALYC
jgi:hypothetical protein